jgi:transmembrane sensor
MNNVVELTSKDAIEAQAAQWIARLDRGLASAEEERLKQWLRQSDAHRRALMTMAELWDKMDDLSRLASLFERPAQPARQYPLRAPAALAACCAALVLAISLALGPALFKATPGQMVEGYYQTAIGQHSVVDLPDGSRLTLNTDTLVRVDYNNNARLLILERGEIHIEVAHDKTRPLSVLAQDKLVQAVGTAFNVRIAGQRQVEVIVTDGKVRVAQDLPKGQPMAVAQAVAREQEKSVAVTRGEKFMLGRSDAAVKKMEQADLSARLSWREGNLVFRGETLVEALTEIGRYTSTRFEIADPALEQVRIAGLFKAGDVEGLLVALKQNFDIEHRRISTDTIILTAAP